QFQANQAAGQAFQGAVGPNGSFDPNAAMSAVAGNPAAALAAPEAIQRSLAARGQNIANSTAALALGDANAHAIANAFAPLAQKNNPTMDDVYSAAALAARLGADPRQISGIIAGINPKNIKSQIGTIANYALGPAGSSARTTGPIGPNGEPTTTSVGAINAGSPTLQSGLGPQQTADQQAFIADQAKSAQTLANIRPLEQALPLVGQLSHFNYGPGSEDINKVKGLLTTLGISGVDPDSEVAVRQEVNKKLLQYARGARDSGRSDSALATAIESNPNLDLTQPANLALIENQIGMDKQDAAVPLAAGSWPGYLNFKNNWYQNTDPRGFGNLTHDDLVELAKSAKGSPKDQNSERSRLNRSIIQARKLGLASVPTE